MWATQGDVISKQYAGTAALKGDYTRTGERKISGVVRDGVNSANRYYLNRFKDAYRQAVIDIMQGNPVVEALSSPENEKPIAKSSSGHSLSTSLTSSSLSSNDQEYHERIKLVIDDCKKILVKQEEVILGGWPLVDADPVTGTALSSTRVSGELPESDMDIVLILTKDCYYVADYDDQTDRIIKYQKVLLEDLERIELGAEPNYQAGPFAPIRGSNRNLISYAVRFHYTIGNQTGYFHMFRSTGTRFFNNMAIPIRTREEALESLKAICESFKVALSVKELNVPFHECRLEKRKSKRLYSSAPSSACNESSSQNGRFRNLASDSGTAGSSVGSRKLFTGMYSHFSRLRGKITGGLQLDGLGKPSQALYEQTFAEECESIDSSPSSRKPRVKIDDDESDESDEEDSMQKIRKKYLDRTGQSSTANSSSSHLERTLSSESDFDSELMLPPISEIGLPGIDEPMCHKENMDRVLESCGILVTSPPLRCPSQESHNSSDQHNQEGALFSGTPTKTKSVLADVDDFVLDSMKKASLRQLHRKAVSKSQVSLCSSTASICSSTIDNPTINIDPSCAVDCSGMPVRSSNRCIFSSELALNSIASQSIKRDIVHKLSSSISTDAIDSGVALTRAKNDSSNLAYQCGAYPLMSSSSFAALSYPDDDLKLLDGSLNALPEHYLEHDDQLLHRANIDSAMLSAIGSKESSLSVSDLATGMHAGLKTSRSSNTLKVS